MIYGTIRSHFKALLNRTDITNTLADVFIDQGITRVQRTLRVPSMEKQQIYTLTTQTSHILLPSDFLEIIEVSCNGSSLLRVPAGQMTVMKKTNAMGTPDYFTREGASLLLYPEPATDVVINYYATFTAMTTDADENSLALFAPDLIIYGALSYAADYYLDERGQIFNSKYSQFLAEVQEQADAAETSGTVQAFRPAATY